MSSVEIRQKLLFKLNREDKHALLQRLSRLDVQDLRAMLATEVKKSNEHNLQLLNYESLSDIFEITDLALHVLSFMSPKAFAKSSQINCRIANLVLSYSKHYFADYVCVLNNTDTDDDDDITFPTAVTNDVSLECKLKTLKYVPISSIPQIPSLSLSKTMTLFIDNRLIRMSHLRIIDICIEEENDILKHLLHQLPQLTHITLRLEYYDCEIDLNSLFNLPFNANSYSHSRELFQLKCLQIYCDERGCSPTIVPNVENMYAYQNLTALGLCVMKFANTDVIQNLFENVRNLKLLSLNWVHISDQSQTLLVLPPTLIALRFYSSSKSLLKLKTELVSLQNCDELIYLDVDSIAQLDVLLEQEMNSHIAAQLEYVVINDRYEDNGVSNYFDDECEYPFPSIQKFDFHHLKSVLYCDTYCEYPELKHPNNKRTFEIQTGSGSGAGGRQRRTLDVDMIQNEAQMHEYFKLFADEQLFETLTIWFHLADS